VWCLSSSGLEQQHYDGDLLQPKKEKGKSEEKGRTPAYSHIPETRRRQKRDTLQFLLKSSPTIQQQEGARCFR
jgi:hypothetical protein